MASNFSSFMTKFLSILLSLCLLFIGSTFARRKFHGRATWYHAGIGACGGWNVDSDHIAALPPVEFARGTRCGRTIRVNHQGKSITAKVVDLCPSCGWTGIDLSRSAFAELGLLDEGVLHVVWEFT